MTNMWQGPNAMVRHGAPPATNHIRPPPTLHRILPYHNIHPPPPPKLPAQESVFGSYEYPAMCQPHHLADVVPDAATPCKKALGADISLWLQGLLSCL